jgi:hypothetical protein
LGPESFRLHLLLAGVHLRTAYAGPKFEVRWSFWKH